MASDARASSDGFMTAVVQIAVVLPATTLGNVASPDAGALAVAACTHSPATSIVAQLFCFFMANVAWGAGWRGAPAGGC